MSIEIPTELLTASSGSVGDTVFSRNQHGPYSKPRVSPNDPGSAQQLAVRAALSQCVTAWNSTLTQAEREGWATLSLALRTTNGLGVSRNAGGLPTYIRANVPRIQAAEVSLPRVDVAPSLFDLGPFTLPSPILLDAAADKLQVFFTEADAWTTEDGAAMLFWASRPMSTAVNFHKGPYRYAACILGDSVAPPTSPASIDLPFPAATGDRIFIRGRVTRTNARLSRSFRLPVDQPAIPGPLPISVTYYPSPFFRCFVFFDQLLVPRGIDRLNWSMRYNNIRYFANLASTNLSYVHFWAAGPLPRPGIDSVTYAPPPFDVVSAGTGVPAPPFAEFPF